MYSPFTGYSISSIHGNFNLVKRAESTANLMGSMGIMGIMGMMGGMGIFLFIPSFPSFP